MPDSLLHRLKNGLETAGRRGDWVEIERPTAQLFAYYLRSLAWHTIMALLGLDPTFRFEVLESAKDFHEF